MCCHAAVPSCLISFARDRQLFTHTPTKRIALTIAIVSVCDLRYLVFDLDLQNVKIPAAKGWTKKIRSTINTTIKIVSDVYCGCNADVIAAVTRG